MDYAWSFCIYRRQIQVSVQQAMHQRATVLAAARMNNQPRRFTEDQEMLVFKKDGEIDWFWLQRRRGRWWKINGERIVRAHFVGSFYLPPLNKNVA